MSAANESDGAVMADLEASGQFSHLDGCRSRETFDGQQRLVLLTGESCGTGGGFAVKLQ